MNNTSAYPRAVNDSAHNTASRQQKRGKRIMCRFWLTADNEIDNEIGWHLYERKRRRKMTQTIRDGVRLVVALERGDVSVLLQLFPETPRYLRQHLIGGD